MLRPVFLAAGLFALAGCASSPGPSSVLTTGPGASSSPERDPGVDWSDGLSEDEFLRAIERHGQVRGAFEEIEAARARRVTASTYPLNPELELAVAQGFDGDQTAAGFKVRQVLELGGRVSRRETVADAGIAKARAEAQNTLRELRSRARKAYWQAVAAQRRFDISRSNVELVNKAVEAAVARFDARQATGIEVDLARVGAAKARAAAKKAEGEIRAARAQIEVLCGGSPPEEWVFADAVPRDRKEPDLARALAAARGGRPDLAALSAAETEAEARGRLAEAEAAPDLGFGIGYEFERDRIEGDGVDFRTRDHVVTFGISLSLPLWNRRRGEVAESEADRRRFAAQRAGLDTEITAEVKVALARLKFAAESLALYEKEIVPASAKSLEQIREAYSTGTFDITALLRAQEDHQQNLSDAAEAEAAWAEARAELEDALGRPISEVLK